ncbi:MAG TPA: ABC transporter substrate-binding protein [Actinomycetota bacterium]|nr:ABC transporter substrate-binding protein [Actinomycetota bacterium]
MSPRRPLSVLVAVALVAAACGGGDGGGSAAGGGFELPQRIGETEGELNLIAWEGYVESGENDPAFDWVTPFEKKTGCRVEVKYAESSDEMVTLMRPGAGRVYDGVSASGDASNRLIAGGDVAEINIELIPGFDDVMPSLRSPGHNTIDGRHYGVPYLWGPNVLMYNTEEVDPAPTSWADTWDADSPYAGRVTAYDSPIFIADAAMYLMATQPDLEITDPYELSQEQLDAAIELLQQQNDIVGKYWASAAEEIEGFSSGDLVIGTAWPYQVNVLEAEGEPVEAVFPEEGMTGWADTWMMSSNAEHPNCMYEWMKWTMTPKVQAEAATWFGATPSLESACAPLREAIGKATRTDYHCGEETFLNSIHLWKTPLPDCGDERGTTCADYSEWTTRWEEVRGT